MQDFVNLEVQNSWQVQYFVDLEVQILREFWTYFEGVLGEPNKKKLPPKSTMLVV